MTEKDCGHLLHLFLTTVEGKYVVRARAWRGRNPADRARRESLRRLEAVGLAELFTARSGHITHVRLTAAGVAAAKRLTESEPSSAGDWPALGKKPAAESLTNLSLPKWQRSLRPLIRLAKTRG